ncbi:MAG: NPCBM/NEW2 domain-containing protein, partial [Planctomycetota bacterium]
MIPCGVTFLAALLAAAQPPAATAEAATVGGEAFTGRLVAIDAARARFATAAGARSVPLRDLWTVRLAEPKDLMATADAAVLVLRRPRRGRLAVKGLTVADGRISGDSALLGRFRLDVGLVEAIYLPPPHGTPGACRDAHLRLALPGTRQDFLVAEDKQGKWIPMPGVLKGISGTKVTFHVGGADRTIDLAGVRVIQLARASTTTAPSAPRGELIGVDGSAVPFAKIALTGPTLSVSSPHLTAPAVKPASVAAIRFGSDRVVYLSDLDPAKVSQAGLFDVTFPFRRDRSSSGKPIRLGGKTYDRGLGLHSRCRLTYDLGGRFAVLTALAGIDDAARGLGFVCAGVAPAGPSGHVERFDRFIERGCHADMTYL